MGNNRKWTSTLIRGFMGDFNGVAQSIEMNGEVHGDGKMLFRCDSKPWFSEYGDLINIYFSSGLFIHLIFLQNDVNRYKRVASETAP